MIKPLIAPHQQISTITNHNEKFTIIKSCVLNFDNKSIFGNCKPIFYTSVKGKYNKDCSQFNFNDIRVLYDTECKTISGGILVLNNLYNNMSNKYKNNKKLNKFLNNTIKENIFLYGILYTTNMLQNIINHVLMMKLVLNCNEQDDQDKDGEVSESTNNPVEKDKNNKANGSVLCKRANPYKTESEWKRRKP